MMEEWQESLASNSSSASSGKSEQIRELNERLLGESLSRQEAGDLYKRLQEEYDILLAKHAQAENTIDQLRIGARVNLFSDSPAPNQAVESKLIEFKSAPRQVLYSKSERGILSGPNGDIYVTKSSSAGLNDFPDGENARNLPTKMPEVDHVNVAVRLKDLQNDIHAFQSALNERELSYEQQRNLYNALKDKHDNLKRQVEHLNRVEKTKSRGIDPSERPPAKFMDPNSLEGELYRLELRLGEVCDDIGEQLFSEKQNGGGNEELERALRNDFQRLRLLSTSPEHQMRNSAAIEGRQLSFVSSESHGRASRSRSLSSERSKNAHSDIHQTGSSSPQEKQPNYSEELAESGYYASESLIRESPTRDHSNTNVPHQYLTRSRSPDMKNPGMFAQKRHWSLREFDQPIESTEELIVYSSEESELREKYPDVPSRPNLKSKLPDWKDDRNNSRGSRANSRTKRDNHSSRHSSVQGKRPSITPDHNQPGPTATSSPLDEYGKSIATPVGKESAQWPGYGKPTNANRTNSSRNSHRDSYSEGRKQSSRPGSRLSKVRSTPLRNSSSEESLANTRGDRVNSSAYSEQDKVPSLIDQPKGNIYGLRHRPNTADSNVDSGFVGSEGTLRSQELHNGNRQQKALLQAETRPMLSQTQGRYQSDEGKEMREQNTQLNPPTAAHHSEKLVTNERKHHPRHLRKSKSANKGAKSSPEQESWDRYSEINGGSSVMLNQPTNSREQQHDGRRLSDDITSIGSQHRVPMRVLSAESSPIHRPITTSDSYNHDNHYGFRERLKPRRDHKRPSFASTEPRLSVIYQEDDTYVALPGPRARRPQSSPTSTYSNREEDKITRSGPRSDRSFSTRPQEKSTRSDNHNEPLRRSSVDQRTESYYAEPLREELQLLRSEIARLSRAQVLADQIRHDLGRSDNRTDDRPAQSNTTNPIFDELKQKIQDLSEQLDRSAETIKEKQRVQKSNHENDQQDHTNQHYEELKSRIDALARDMRMREDARPNITIPPTPSAQLHPNPSVITPVCPICSGTGYHQHGSYVFPRDFLDPGGSVTVFRPQESAIVKTAQPGFVTSTPHARETHIVHHSPTTRVVHHSPTTPIAYSTDPKTYRVISDVVTKGATSVYPVANTVHHIHTFHETNRSKVVSSSDCSSDEDDHRSRSRGRSKSRSRSRSTRQSLNKINGWRINDSLNEAGQAASGMQRISRRILNTLASDLIKSGHSEF